MHIQTVVLKIQYKLCLVKESNEASPRFPLSLLLFWCYLLAFLLPPKLLIFYHDASTEETLTTHLFVHLKCMYGTNSLLTPTHIIRMMHLFSFFLLLFFLFSIVLFVYSFLLFCLLQFILFFLFSFIFLCSLTFVLPYSLTFPFIPLYSFPASFIFPLPLCHYFFSFLFYFFYRHPNILFFWVFFCIIVILYRFFLAVHLNYIILKYIFYLQL